MSLNLDLIIDPKDVAERMAQTQDQAEAIADAIGHTFEQKPLTFFKHIHTALTLPVDSVEHFASRFVVHHGTYVRYCNQLRRWQAYVYDTTKRGQWRTIYPTSTSRLIEKQVSDTVIEAAILSVAKKIGVIETIPEQHNTMIARMVTAIRKDSTQIGDIEDALEVKLKRSIICNERPEREKDANSFARKISGSRPAKTLDF